MPATVVANRPANCVRQAADRAEQILDEIRENFSRIRHQSEDEDFFVTFSCGVACYPSHEEEGELEELEVAPAEY